jgi:hypothetical protein
MSLDGPMLNNATAFTTSACECKPDVGWAGTLLPSLTRSGHRRQIKSNGLSEAGSIEKMSADCARLKPSAGLIDCISKARSIAASRENPLGWAAEWFLTHTACHGIGSILATLFPARSGFVARFNSDQNLGGCR